MKVISLKEPFATLIKDKDKHIETRSWKTTYRGEIYIHASLSCENLKGREELISLVGNRKLNNGYIICKCKLGDCIYMTQEYVDNIKKNNYKEYLCGNYSVGRYAWVLEDIKPLSNKIEVKGHLGIWNY